MKLCSLVSEIAHTSVIYSMFEGLDMPTCDVASFLYRKWNSGTVSSS